MSVLAWDVKKHCPVPTSLHMFNVRQLPIRSKTMALAPPVAVAEPSGRCVAVLMHQSVLAVLPAVSPGISQQVACMHSAAAVGNSFVIDLASHGIRTARDVTFLHEYGLLLLPELSGLSQPTRVLCPPPGSSHVPCLHPRFDVAIVLETCSCAFIARLTEPPVSPRSTILHRCSAAARV